VTRTAADPDLAHLRSAARLALRGHGGAEPNPLVGCVITDPRGVVVGAGYHRRFGGPHAEVVALARAGGRAAGATAYVTLEPCAHTGKTGPCTDALIRARVARVVYGASDPNEVAAGGAQRLAAAGIEVVQRADCAEARRAAAPFVHRVRTGLPWITAKWAQTIDGRIATRAGASRWISGRRSRAMVHRERGRTDAILTGIGTVRADDPMLTARGVRVRRRARRIVVDPDLAIDDGAAIVRTAGEVPTTVVTATDRAAGSRANALAARGVEVFAAPEGPGGVDLAAALRGLAARHGLAHVLVEAGAGLLGALLRARLVNDAWVIVAPMILGDEAAVASVRGRVAPALTDAIAMTLAGVHRRGADVVIRYET
jgi:diaminohydroxyphosphoribosylaminopyrimidine deaminase/5-amino-6-(5-phosphoribosylamino)uracil reductase